MLLQISSGSQGCLSSETWGGPTLRSSDHQYGAAGSRNILWEAEGGESVTERTNWPRNFKGQDTEDPGFRQDPYGLTTKASGNGGAGVESRGTDDETQTPEPLHPLLMLCWSFEAQGQSWRQEGGGNT